MCGWILIVLFTFFEAPKRHLNNVADKQKTSVKQEKNPIFYQQKSQVYVLFLHFLAIFFKWVIWASRLVDVLKELKHAIT